MAIIDLFSKRLKRETEGEVDVYQYTDIPKKFRVQAIHIIQEAFGEKNYQRHHPDELFGKVHKILCKEYGVFNLQKYSNSDRESVLNFLLNATSYEQVLDVIEICFKYIDIVIRENTKYDMRCLHLTPDEAITELNMRFKENGIGYRFESNQLIKIDCELLHKELIKPTLLFLNEKRYKNASDEFLSAFEHYRHDRKRECLVDCLKAFESTMKIICDKNNWEYNQKDTAKKLISVLFANELIPPYMQNQITSLRTLLESGIPTLRNKLGGHGQGVNTSDVDEYVVNYALNLTASNIKYLVELEKAKK